MASTAFRITFTGERPPTRGALASIFVEAAAGDRLACEFSIEQTGAAWRAQEEVCEECGAAVPIFAGGVAGSWHDPGCSAYADGWS
jgi:hypothetical protein